MLIYLFLLFTVLPLAELALLIWIGTKTSVAFTFALVLLSGILGAALARWQGWRTMQRIRIELREGRVPADALIDGVLILAAGLMLVTPGVLTDGVGFALLVPPVRRFIKRRLAAWFRQRYEIARAGSQTAWTPSTARDEIIDARVLGTRVEDAAPYDRSP